MPIHQMDDPNFFEDFSSESLAWYRKVFRDFDCDGGRIVLGDDPWDLSSPTVAVVKMPPGYELKRHAHDCHAAVVIVQGSLEMGDGRSLKVGDLDIHPRKEYYGPYTAGPDGCTFYEFLTTSELKTLVPEDQDDASALAYIAEIHAAEERARAAGGPKAAGIALER